MLLTIFSITTFSRRAPMQPRNAKTNTIDPKMINNIDGSINHGNVFPTAALSSFSVLAYIPTPSITTPINWGKKRICIKILPQSYIASVSPGEHQWPATVVLRVFFLISSMGCLQRQTFILITLIRLPRLMITITINIQGVPEKAPHF